MVDEKPSNLDDKIGAIRRAIKLGRVLQEDLPEVARMYEEGNSYPSIAKELDISKRFDVSKNVARVSLSYALNGHKGGFNVGVYDGLLSEERMRELYEEHAKVDRSNSGKARAASTKKIWDEIRDLSDEVRIAMGLENLTREACSQRGSIGGTKSAEMGVGIHAASSEKKSEWARKGNAKRRKVLSEAEIAYLELPYSEKRRLAGLKAAETNRRNGTGLFGFTNEERSDYSKEAYAQGKKEGNGIGGLNSEERRKNGINSAISRGFIPWTEREFNQAYSTFGEIEFAYMLSTSSKYQHQKGSWRGKPNWSTIKDVLNNEYGNDRTEKKISAQISRYRKKLKKAVA